MKKVYTITFHLANNYGAMLQTYALQKILLKKYDSRVLNYDNYIISNTYRIIRKGTFNVLKIVYAFIRKLPYIFVEYKRMLNFNKFRSKIKMTTYFDNIAHFDTSNIDCIVTGSDQVWNYKLTNNIDETYFLNFPFDGKKISYAASCGKNENLEKTSISMIKKLDKISVREESLKKYLCENGINDVETVLDPTLLLEKQDWLELDINNRLITEKYIFVYSVSNETPEFLDFVNLLSKETNFKIIYFDKKNKTYLNNKKSFYNAGPIEFLNLLYNSEYVITTSFHGLALSSILNKKMFVFLSTFPDRLISLTQKLGLSDRIIIGKKYDINELLSKNIDWNFVNSKLNFERNKSLEWLWNSLEGVKENDKGY